MVFVVAVQMMTYYKDYNFHKSEIVASKRIRDNTRSVI